MSLLYSPLISQAPLLPFSIPSQDVPELLFFSSGYPNIYTPVYTSFICSAVVWPSPPTSSPLSCPLISHSYIYWSTSLCSHVTCNMLQCCLVALCLHFKTTWTYVPASLMLACLYWNLLVCLSLSVSFTINKSMQLSWWFGPQFMPALSGR